MDIWSPKKPQLETDSDTALHALHADCFKMVPPSA